MDERTMPIHDFHKAEGPHCEVCGFCGVLDALDGTPPHYDDATRFRHPHLEWCVEATREEYQQALTHEQQRRGALEEALRPFTFESCSLSKDLYHFPIEREDILAARQALTPQPTTPQAAEGEETK